MLLNFIIKSYKLTSSIQKNKKRSYIIYSVMMCGDILLFGGMISALFQTSELIYLATIIGLIFCAGFSFVLKNLSKIYQSLILKVMSKIQCTHPDWPNQVNEEITRRAEALTERESGIEIICLILSVSVCTYCPYFYLITKPGIALDDPDLEIIPFFHSYWKTKTVKSLVCKRIFEGMISVSNIFAYLSCTVFMIYTIFNLEAHINEANNLLSGAIDSCVKEYMNFEEFQQFSEKYNFKIDSYVIRNHSECWKRRCEKSIERQYIRMVKYHQFIHSYIKDVTEFLNKVCTALLAWHILPTILFSFTFLQVTYDYIFIIKMLSLVIHCTIALHLYCNMAESIHRMNASIMDSFYNTAWYYLLPKSRKNLLFTLIFCQRKYNVKSFGMYVVNLNLFIYALRIVYSAMNIILMVQKK